MAKFKTFTPAETNGVTVIHLTSSYFNEMEMASFRQEFLMFLQEQQPMKIVVDFNEVQKFGSEAVGILIQAAKRTRTNGGELVLCSMGARVKEIFDICVLIPSTFKLYNSVGEAVAAVDG